MGILGWIRGVLVLGFFCSSVFAANQNAEIKIFVKRSEIEKTLKILGLQKNEADQGKIIYLDSQNHRLRRKHIIVRFRESEDGDADVAVKIRPYHASQKNLDEDFVEKIKAKLDYDIVGRKNIKALALREDGHRRVIRDALDSSLKFKKILSADQKKLVRRALDGDIRWSRLKILGPAKEWFWSGIQIEGYPEPVGVELWEFPDGYQSLEISLKSSVSVARSTRRSCIKNIQALGIRVNKSSPLKTSLMYQHASD